MENPSYCNVRFVFNLDNSGGSRRRTYREGGHGDQHHIPEGKYSGIQYCQLQRDVYHRRIFETSETTWHVRDENNPLELARGVSVLIFIWALAVQKLPRYELRSAWVYHNPLLVLSAVLLFQLFRNMNFSSRVINEFAGASFTCFLVHNIALNKVGIQAAVDSGVPGMLLHILIVILSTYLLSYLVWKLYELCTGWLTRILKRLKLFRAWEV